MLRLVIPPVNVNAPRIIKNQPLLSQKPAITESEQGQIIDRKGKIPMETPVAPNVAQLKGVQLASRPILGFSSISRLQ